MSRPAAFGRAARPARRPGRRTAVASRSCVSAMGRPTSASSGAMAATSGWWRRSRRTSSIPSGPRTADTWPTASSAAAPGRCASSTSTSMAPRLDAQILDGWCRPAGRRRCPRGRLTDVVWPCRAGGVPRPATSGRSRSTGCRRRPWSRATRASSTPPGRLMAGASRSTPAMALPSSTWRRRRRPTSRRRIARIADRAGRRMAGRSWSKVGATAIRRSILVPVAPSTSPPAPSGT